MPKWDYVCVNLVRSYGMNYRRNGIKMAEWKDKPVFEMMQMLGEEGYEFTGYDGQNYIFKKPINPPQATGQVQTRPAANGQPAPGAPRPTQPIQGIQRPPQPGQAPQGQPRPATGAQPTAGLRSLRPTTPEDES